MLEVEDETSYVKHHKKKIAFLFSAMRHFAAELRDQGWNVDYVTLDDAENSGNFSGEVRRALARHTIKRLVVTEPGEYRVRKMIDSWPKAFGVSLDIMMDQPVYCQPR